MPNWCWNSIVFFGNDNEVNKLKHLLDKVTDVNYKYPSNSWDNKWLGNIFIELGYSKIENKELHCTVPCRGHIITYHCDKDNIGSYIQIDYESAWENINDSWDTIINKYFPNLSYVYFEDEPGNCVLVNSDTKGRFFKDHFKLRVGINKDEYDEYENYEEEYFENLNDCINYLNDKYHKNIQLNDSILKADIDTNGFEILEF